MDFQTSRKRDYKMSLTDTSRFISLILRHKPETIGITLDEHGWAEVLYHGTGEKFTASIDEKGLIPKSRLYVHLSQDEATAKNVGSRHFFMISWKIRIIRKRSSGSSLETRSLTQS